MYTIKSSALDFKSNSNTTFSLHLATESHMFKRNKFEHFAKTNYESDNEILDNS